MRKMFVQFVVENFLSFKDSTTFSMVGYPPIKEHENDEYTCNVFPDPTEKIKLLKSSVLYGANGSGKSNLLAAMGFFRNFILTSSSEKQADDEINVLRFLLSIETDKKPSSFEMIFYIDDIRFRFGFEVDKEKIHSEWLFSLKNETSAKETKLFTREFQEIKPNRQFFKEGKGLEDKTRSNALFLSTVAQLNGEIATRIIQFFRKDFRVVSGLEDENYASFTIDKCRTDPRFKTQLVEFFKNIRIGFEDMEIIEEDNLFTNFFSLPKEIPPELQEVLKDLKNIQDRMKNIQNTKVESKSITINFLHRKFDETENFLGLIVLDFGLQSKGTQKLFNIFGILIDSIENGRTLVVDELDSRLHTLLTMELIKFFHSKANKNAQLIFASHDTNLLRRDIFRRDQIWFTEKNQIGSTDLYSLVEYKVNQATVRNDASFEKDYLLGKYGAIPFLGNIKKFKTEFLNE
ncbi:MAG: ATP-binding protein [Bacteroidia bacterium]|nr:ATP-binding protein [Bacteroidia bacterium]